MNLIDGYRYLAALEQHRHFGRAAAACHITQPALSNALRALEQHFGISIVRRGRQYEGLTPEGEMLLAAAHRILREQEVLVQQLAASAPHPGGRLVIGAVPTALPIAARFCARLVQRHPGLQPLLQSLSSQDLETGLDTLAVDLGLGYTGRLSGAASRRLQAWPQYVEHYHLLRRTDVAAPRLPSLPHLRFGAPLRWADAAGLPMCMLSPEMHNRVILDQVFAGLGLKVRPALETNSVAALLAAVQAGPLAAVLPGALVATLAGQGGLEARALIEPELRTPIGFMAAIGAPQPRALQAALDLAADAGWLADAEANSGPLQAA
jgi:DNA-binding transcriptional LysR family regulator